MSKLSVVGSISRLCPNIPLLVLPPVYVQTLCCWFHHPFMSKYSVAGSAPVNVQIFCCWFHHPLMSKHSVVGSNTRSTQCLAFLLTQRRCPVQSRCLLRLRRLVFVFSSRGRPLALGLLAATITGAVPKFCKRYCSSKTQPITEINYSEIFKVLSVAIQLHTEGAL